MSSVMARMSPRRFIVVLMCVWSVWTSGSVSGCGERQQEMDGRCCDLCPPGQYLKEYCSEHKQTICGECAEGSFSDQYHLFDTCEPCQTCHEYAQKCTPTTDANCSCRPGFLCSNSVCSKCEENKCVAGEELKRTEKSRGNQLVDYSYQCLPVCTEAQYYDVKTKTCKPRTQCSLFGRAELFPGNKTHNSLCDGGESSGDGRDFFPVIFGIGFVLLSLILLMLLSYACIRNLRKHKAGDQVSSFTAVSTNLSDFHLSKEESGLQIFIQDETKPSSSFCDLNVDIKNLK